AVAEPADLTVVGTGVRNEDTAWPRAGPRCPDAKRPRPCYFCRSVTSDLIFRRFFSITLLAVVISGLSLAAVMRTLSLGMAQRIERAREAVNDELNRLASLAPPPAALGELTATTYVGVRGGWLDVPVQAAQVQALPPDWRAPLERTVAA